MSMKETLKKARHNTLCGLAASICANVRMNFVVLEREDFQPLCRAVAHLCKLHDCQKPSSMCLKASEAKTDKDFLKICRLSCGLCEEQRKPKKLKAIPPNVV